MEPVAGSSMELPTELRPVLERSITAQYTSLTRALAPMMVTITPFVADDRATLDVYTGLTYPTKAERARRNPKVSLLYCDPVGSGLDQPPVVLVQGLATVRDADVQANTDRYVRLAMAKTPAAFKGQPKFLLRTGAWYFAAIWVQVTPMRIWWWDSPTMRNQPDQWVAPAETVAPPSDPAPPGRQPGAWLEPASDWHATARDVIPRLEQRSLAWVGADGFPVSVPVTSLDHTERGFRLHVGHHLPGAPAGPACLTVHTHPKEFTSQENRTLIGEVAGRGGSEEFDFIVERALAHWSVTGNKLVASVGFVRKRRKLKPRLASEAARRGQPVPTVRLP